MINVAPLPPLLPAAIMAVKVAVEEDEVAGAMRELVAWVGRSAPAEDVPVTEVVVGSDGVEGVRLGPVRTLVTPKRVPDPDDVTRAAETTPVRPPLPAD